MFWWIAGWAVEVVAGKMINEESDKNGEEVNEDDAIFSGLAFDWINV